MKHMMAKINNYDRFDQALVSGITEFEYTANRYIRDMLASFIHTINPILLNRLIHRIKDMGFNPRDPMDIEFKYMDFVKCVDEIKYLAPATIPISVNVNVQNPEPEIEIDFAIIPSILFNYNGSSYYGHRSLVFDPIICLREIKDVANFDQQIELSGQMPRYMINLWIRSMYTKQINIEKIMPCDMVAFLNHVDQYPTDFLTINTLELNLIKYFDDDQMHDNELLEYLRNLSHRYKLKYMYLWIHNKIIA